MQTIVLFLGFLALFTESLSQNTTFGGRVTIPPTSVNLMMIKLMPKLAQDIPKIPIPDVSGSIGTVVGNINYQITSIHLLSFSIASTSASFSAPNVINGQITGSVVSMNSNWAYKQQSWPYLGDAGSMDGTVSVSGGFTIAVTVDPVTKSMKFQMLTFTPSITGMQLELHGGASWLYNIFLTLFQGPVIGVVQDQLSQTMPKMIESILQAEISNLYNPYAPVASGDLMSDFSFQKIDLCPEYMTVGVPATVFMPNTTFPQYSGQPRPLPAFDKDFSDQMYQIFLDEYYFNSLGWALVQTKKMNGKVLTADNVPQEMQYYFMTSSYEQMIPALATSYPNRKMKIEIFPAKDLISFNIKPEGISGSTDLALVVSVLDPQVEVFTISVSLLGDLKLKFVDLENTVFADVILSGWKAALQKTSIGSFDVNAINSLLSGINEKILLPIANSFSNQGVGIPSISGMSLRDYRYKSQDGFMILSGMMEYVPSANRK